jgi:hypothetical protein
MLSSLNTQSSIWEWSWISLGPLLLGLQPTTEFSAGWLGFVDDQLVDVGGVWVVDAMVVGDLLMRTPLSGGVGLVVRDPSSDVVVVEFAREGDLLVLCRLMPIGESGC